MDDFLKLISKISEENLKVAEKKRCKEERYQNRFNYYNSIIATIALILSIISLLLQA